MSNDNWKKLYPTTITDWVEPSVFSEIPNGFQTNSVPGNKSLNYDPPYFVVYKDLRNSETNFLSYNNDSLQNSNKSILSMITYNNDHNNFSSIYQPEIKLIVQDCSFDNKIFEFAIYDSQRKLVLVADNSVLYVSLKTP